MPGFREVFTVGEYRALFAAHFVSIAGDQFARVALSVHVYARTESAGLTALTYALTFLPDLVGGPLLTGLADRFPRRQVMITTDLVRALLLALMAIPQVPLWLLCTLLVAAQLAGAPGNAARAALLPQVLPGELYAVGQAAMNTVTQVAQVAGFVTGGGLVAWIGARGVLLADAATFLASALLITRWVIHRPASMIVRDRTWHLVQGVRLVSRRPMLRALVAMACVSGFYIAGEALAAPYAVELGAGPIAVGLMFAAYAAGTATGMLVLARLTEPARLRAMPLLVIAACAPLTLCVLQPGLAGVLLLFTLSGAGSSYHLVTATTFVRAVPDELRGQSFGLAVTALRVSQGLGVAAAGVAADHWAPHLVVAAAGALGVLTACGTAWLWTLSNDASRWGATSRWDGQDGAQKYG
ncbi:MFS transporter [Lentzea sp. NBRC 105346]|uniref:MFS transporter n=1 Tax=Lentzea sp. NBRC 105346 TaxID=3032205 RepID=UPI0024A04385|nr:MFS transporter [Lentzea sp. NBRC 105346]GLZ28362.1 MFS transporter [Lentzea sp. NBRC 105346]